MALGCGSQFAKYVLFFFNFVFWVSGAALLGLGIWFRVDEKALQVLHVVTVSTSDDLVQAAAYTFIAVGAIVFITGFLGCCGAIKESSCMLMTYAVIVGLLLILEIVAGILVAVFRNDILNTLDESMNKTVIEYYDQEGHEASTKAWDYTQVEFKCCGAVAGPSDWRDSVWFDSHKDDVVPATCCVLENKDAENPKPVNRPKCIEAALNPSMDNANNFVHTKGCSMALRDWIKDHAAILIGVAFGVAVLQVFTIMLACCLKRSVKTGYEYV